MVLQRGNKVTGYSVKNMNIEHGKGAKLANTFAFGFYVSNFTI